MGRSRVFVVMCAGALTGCGVLLGLNGDDETPTTPPPPDAAAPSADGTSGAEGSADGSTDGSGDGGPTGAACAHDAPFTTPKRPLTGLATPANLDRMLPRLTPDEKILYFYDRDLNDFTRVYRAQRASRMGLFDWPLEQTFDSSVSSPRQAIPSADDQTLLFVSGSPFVLRSATMRSGNEWLNVTGALALPPNNVSTPFRTLDALYVTLFGQASPVANIHRIAQDGITAQVVTELDGTGRDTDPTFSPDGLVIYFYSERGRPLDQGSIYRASRPSIALPFSAPVEVSEIGRGTGYVSPGTISPDGCRLYYYGAEADAGAALFLAERSP